MHNQLNLEQKIAVESTGHVLLTACPGSGKTRVLTHKVAYELERKHPKSYVIAITFTNRASDEIKHRIDRLSIDDTYLWSGTIHSFCLEWIIRPYAGILDELKNGFSVADEYTSRELLKMANEESGLNRNIYFINTRWTTDGEYFDPDQSNRDVLDIYHDILKSKKLIDFDLILFYAFKILNLYPKIGKILNNIFHIICVDEYQDTQELQYAILSKIIAINESKTRLFMVGDKDQAIYDSLGGVAKDIDEIRTDFGNIEISPLELFGNYRTCQRIIDYYRIFQTANIEIESRCGYAEESGLITYDDNLDKDNLAQYISRIIRENLNNGILEKEICVLAPQWFLVIPMGRQLKSLLPDVNFDAYGLSPLHNSRENIWYKVARLLLVEPSSRMYFNRIRWAKELIQEFSNFGIILYRDDDYSYKKILRIINSIESNATEGDRYLLECFAEFLSLMNVNINDYIQLKEAHEKFFENLREKLDNPRFGYAREIEFFKKIFEQGSGVVVNTCHGIKGEEFHTVIAFGILDRYIPHKSATNPIESANKLLYVICSRAKKNLHLISETGRVYKEGWQYYSYVPTDNLAQINYLYD